MSRRLHDYISYLSFLPFLALATIQENGPSWKEIGTWAAGGAFAMVVFLGGYMFNMQAKVDADQNVVISDLSKTITEQRIQTTTLTATIQNVNDSQKKLQDTLDYERKRREMREDQERADLRAGQGKK